MMCMLEIVNYILYGYVHCMRKRARDERGGNNSGGDDDDDNIKMNCEEIFITVCMRKCI